MKLLVLTVGKSGAPWADGSRVAPARVYEPGLVELVKQAEGDLPLHDAIP